nr:hypothetical protein CFP56_11730 [Quercus suber]
MSHSANKFHLILRHRHLDAWIEQLLVSHLKRYRNDLMMSIEYKQPIRFLSEHCPTISSASVMLAICMERGATLASFVRTLIRPNGALLDISNLLDPVVVTPPPP